MPFTAAVHREVRSTLLPSLAALAFLFTLAIANSPVVFAQQGNTPAPFNDWQTTLNADRPLVGKIFDVKANQFISPDQLIDALSTGKYVLLGEIHDNPDHHRLQAWIIAQLVDRHRTPSIVMEQIRADQAGALKLFMSGKFKTAQRMGPAIGWEKSGWPKWINYQPIAKVALGAGLPIFAGDTTREMNRKVGKQGFKALPEGETKQLGLDHPLGRALDGALLNELVGSHCNMMPAKMMGPMALVQRYRDAHLARAMLDADKKDGTVLIAGNGHVRTDRAVPWYLRGEQIPSTSLMIVEAAKDANTPLEHIPLDPNNKATADYIWITPGATRKDPCAKLRKQFSGKHGKSGKGEHGKKAE